MSRSPKTPEERVRSAVKALAYSIGSLEVYLAENGGDFNAVATVRGIVADVRIAVRVRRPDKFYKWAMAVLYNNQRIDGIDWEPTVLDHRGAKHNCRGWHRHMWSAAATDTLKECLPHFNPTTVREFILHGFRVLNVQLKREDRENANRLPFD